MQSVYGTTLVPLRWSKHKVLISSVICKTGDYIPQKYGIARYDENADVILFECNRKIVTDSLYLSVHFARFPLRHNGNNTERFGI